MEFAVIGMGRFGRAVARSLAREGQAVLAIDLDPERLEQVSGEVDATTRADTTDEDAMAALRLDRMSCVVVAIGSRATEASLLTVAILRDLQVPRIVARSFDERHARLLLAIGANEVINPEDDMGARLAWLLARPGILDQFQLGDARVAEVEAPEAYVGRSLEELDLTGRHGLAILLLRRGEDVVANPGRQERIESGDVLVVLGGEQEIRGLATLR
ncbi:MAG TPA: TrkA family potassium uptake protein [Thermoanaerobaculia bacterium]|nr:TrkA family potassium uptake protein [Thermoanaerobaculia bacterium]